MESESFKCLEPEAVYVLPQGGNIMKIYFRAGEERVSGDQRLTYTI